MSPKIAVSDFSEIKGKFLHFLKVIVIAQKNTHLSDIPAMIALYEPKLLQKTLRNGSSSNNDRAGWHFITEQTYVCTANNIYFY